MNLYDKVINHIATKYTGANSSPGPSPSPAPVIPPAPRRTTRFGVEIGFSFYGALDLSDLKPKFVREDSNTYLSNDPVEKDTFISSMNAQGIDVLLITPYDYASALSAQQMADQAGAIAKKYAGKIWAYELMNEVNAPNLSNGDTRTFTPERYMQFLTLMAASIRVADPKVKLISSGTSGMSFDWHRQLAALGAGSVVDMVGFHPYGQSPNGVASSVAQLAQIWGSKPLACTEYGSANPLQTVDMMRALDGIVDECVYFTYKSANPSDVYGLLTETGVKRVSYDMMKQLFAK